MLYQSFFHNNINFQTPKWKLFQTIQQIFTIGQLAQQCRCSPQLTHPFMSVWIQSPSYKLDQEINSDFILNDKSNIFWHTFFKRYLVLLLLNLLIKREKQREEEKKSLIWDHHQIFQIIWASTKDIKVKNLLCVDI